MNRVLFCSEARAFDPRVGFAVKSETYIHFISSNCSSERKYICSSYP